MMKEAARIKAHKQNPKELTGGAVVEQATLVH
jgi:hypothetical protein